MGCKIREIQWKLYVTHGFWRTIRRRYLLTMRSLFRDIPQRFRGIFKQAYHALTRFVFFSSLSSTDLFAEYSLTKSNRYCWVVSVLHVISSVTDLHFNCLNWLLWSTFQEEEDDLQMLVVAIQEQLRKANFEDFSNMMDSCRHEDVLG